MDSLASSTDANATDTDEDADHESSTPNDGGIPSTVSDYLVRDVLNRKLEQHPESCPICSSEIGTTLSTVHDRECTQCGTKFTLESEGVPTIHMDTTPVRRIERSLRQKATETAVLNQPGDDQ